MLAKVHAVAEIPPDSGDEEDDDEDVGNESDGGQEKQRTRIYDLELGAPRIEFSGEAKLPAVHLKFPLKTGSYCRSDNLNKKSLPENGYVFTIRNISLGTVTGMYEEVKNKDDLDIKGDCVFKKRPENSGEDDYEVSWVVMDFKLSDKSLLVQVEKNYGDNPTPKRERAINRKFPRAKEFAEAFFLGTSDGDFQNRFRVIRHALATVKNKDLPRQSGVTVDLTPKSFRLATCASTSILKGSVLSLFIHVVDGKDNGEKRDLQTRWRGQWVNASPKIPPIPAPYTASILIHPTLLFEKAIKNSVLTNAGEQGWQINQLTGVAGGGIAFQAVWPRTIAQETFYIKLPREDAEWREAIAGAPYLEVEGLGKRSDGMSYLFRFR
ncbi:hypothetical protein N7478_005029 [Penicillium angulare]|uniref:uncharacterized protein n=1 Tax=Penicillium angulare TaxID=116970 RepID=UPI002541042D|nr:uncharacterized protein N7478_005029 [Penicillium angulare]KAJ5279657.1 hypothetical protein N7478_005029 [Penicillium angulare]